MRKEKKIKSKVKKKVIKKKAEIIPEKISSKKTKPKRERQSTGTPGLDKMIEGGFVTNSINLISGDTGTGKSIFAIQYLLEGLKNGESGLYVSFEEKKENFYKNMKKMGWDLLKAEKSGKFIFLEYSPEKVKMMLDEGGGAVESIVLKSKIKRLVIDSITSFSLLFDDESEKRAAISGIFDIISKWNCTTLLTSQSGNDRKNKSLTSEVDGIILLYLDKVKNDRKRFVEVIKMRGTKHSSARHSFLIKNGVIVK